MPETHQIGAKLFVLTINKQNNETSLGNVTGSLNVFT